MDGGTPYNTKTGSGLLTLDQQDFTKVSNVDVGMNLNCCPSGTALRDIRRSRGLSQTDLANLLSISQSRVSAWERGYDEVPSRLRHQLIDIFLNKNGALDPLIRNMIATETNLAVYSPTYTDGCADFKVLHPADTPNVDFMRPTGGFCGHCVSEFFELYWYKEACAGRSLREKLMVDVERDVVTAAKFGHKPVFRLRTQHLHLAFDGYTELVLARNTMLGQVTNQPIKTRDTLFIDELD